MNIHQSDNYAVMMKVNFRPYIGAPKGRSLGHLEAGGAGIKHSGELIMSEPPISVDGISSIT